MPAARTTASSLDSCCTPRKPDGLLKHSVSPELSPCDCICKKVIISVYVAAPSLLPRLLFSSSFTGPAVNRRVPSAWSCSRFVPIKKRFFSLLLLVVGVRLWIPIKHLEPNIDCNITQMKVK